MLTQLLVLILPNALYLVSESLMYRILLFVLFEKAATHKTYQIAPSIRRGTNISQKLSFKSRKLGNSYNCPIFQQRNTSVGYDMQLKERSKHAADTKWNNDQSSPIATQI